MLEYEARTRDIKLHRVRLPWAVWSQSPWQDFIQPKQVDSLGYPPIPFIRLHTGQQNIRWVDTTWRTTCPLRVRLLEPPDYSTWSIEPVSISDTEPRWYEKKKKKEKEKLAKRWLLSHSTAAPVTYGCLRKSLPLHYINPPRRRHYSWVLSEQHHNHLGQYLPLEYILLRNLSILGITLSRCSLKIPLSLEQCSFQSLWWLIQRRIPQVCINTLLRWLLMS